MQWFGDNPIGMLTLVNSLPLRDNPIGMLRDRILLAVPVSGDEGNLAEVLTVLIVCCWSPQGLP
jgi:hypothetical protein